MLLRTRQKNRGFSSNEFLTFLSDRSERHEVDNEFSKEFRKKPIGTVFFGDVLLVVSVFFDVRVRVGHGTGRPPELTPAPPSHQDA